METASEKQVLDMQSGENNDILVAIWMVTYNQEAYIEQAIESVMMQITSFNFKLFIGEDCSADKTIEICITLKEKYPDKIELISNEKNIGGNLNAKNIFTMCFNSKAKYIALLEGDDYWTDPLKLQKQYDLLENNLELSFCFHKAYRFDIENESRNKLYPENTLSQILDEKDFFKIPTIPTASVVFRNEIKPTNFNHSHGDMLLYATLLTHGKAGFIMEKMSEYRLHPQGVTSKSTENWYLERRINELNIERKHTDFSKKVRSQIERLYINHIMNFLFKNSGKLNFNQKKKYFTCLLKSKYFYKKNFKEYYKLLKICLK